MNNKFSVYINVSSVKLCQYLHEYFFSKVLISVSKFSLGVRSCASHSHMYHSRKAIFILLI